MSTIRDDSWLADAEGNLQPEVARALVNSRHGTVARSTPSAPAPVTDWTGVAIGLALILLAGAGLMIYQLHEAAMRQFHSRVVAENVPLCAAPNGSARVYRLLTVGDKARIEKSENGWYQVRVPGEYGGWVWGGFLGKDTKPWHGPGIVVDSLFIDDATTNRVILPGERVVIEKRGRSRSTLILSDGVRCAAPSKTILALE
jgi:hypothetical protein